MSTPSNALSEQALLAELGWVRRLALSLVSDEATADDVTQDLCVVALERPPHSAHSGASLRAWLATATRTLALTRRRGESRRKRREQRAARVERDDSDLVEAVSLRRDVVVAVLALEEPHRTTLLRFHFEERSTAAIAELAGVSEAAVRQRLVRARAALRERLAASFGEGENGWRRALLRIARENDEPERRTSPMPWIAAGTVAAGVALIAVMALGYGPGESAGTDEGSAPSYAYNAPPPQLVPDSRAARNRRGLARWLMAPGGVGRTSGGAARAPLRAGVWTVANQVGDDDLARELSADVSVEISAVRQAARVPARLRQKVAAHSGYDRALVERAELFDARCASSADEAAVDCRVVRMPLSVAGQPARLTVVIVAGRALTAGCWGTPTFDEDPDWRWSVFLSQLLSVHEKSPHLDLTTASARELDEYRAELARSDDLEHRLARAILAQRLVMAGHAMTGRARRLVERAGGQAPPDWYSLLAARLRALPEHVDALAYVLGDAGAQRHAELAHSTAELFTSFAEALSSQDQAAIAAGAGEISSACSACHRAVDGNGTPFFDAFDPYADELVLPIGALHFELDVAPAPGDDGALSRQFVAAFRAAVVLANEAE